ncbi:hypothetical protein [Olleya sp. YS]|uniref:hypothetical protein n=1 Tax=Olleya sp. YS TaxID=3028318 RepID=UPI0024342407|nr:hypothetical protein [Olleya sp. YS]WGD34993.1 hypothetical protein Ollyesu_00925 [Olleya sp. YS]
MKTKILTTVMTLIFLLVSNLAFSQNDYLKITRSNNNDDFIKYPPGTTFKLKDEKGKVVYSDTSSNREFIIDKSYTLTVFPPYKKSYNTYKLTEGKLEIKNNKEYFVALKKHKKKSKTSQNNKSKNDSQDNNSEVTYTGGISMKKTLLPSAEKLNTYNATFEFSNGIKASYKDGKMMATLDGKTLKIENKYLIYSDYGLIKLSYNPNNGETWWVFDPKK